MTIKAENGPFKHIQTQLNQLAVMVPALKEKGQPAAEVWSSLVEEVENLPSQLSHEYHEAERERLLAETAALYRGSQAIARALSERQIFDVLLDQIRSDNPCEIAVYRFDLVDEEPTWAKITVNWQKQNNPTYPEGTQIFLPDSPLAQILTTPEPLFIDDIANDKRITEAERDSFAPTAACSVAVLPLIARGQELGVVLVYFTHPYSFTSDTQRLWLALTDQVRLGLANHQLLQEATYHVVQMETAAEVARAASSILDLQDLLNSTVELVRDRFNLYYVGVFMVDEEKRWANLRAGTGQAGRAQLDKKHQLEIGGGSMIGWSIHHRKPRIALDVGKEAVHFQNPDLPETRSEMALPLIARNEVIGALTIQSVEPAAFSSEDIIILQLMADQLANAIQNARLFEQAQQEIADRKVAEREITQRNEELAAINRVTSAVVSTLDVEEMLQATAREMVQTFAAHRCGIALLNPESTVLTVVADYATRAEDTLNIGAVIPLADNPSSIKVVETGQPIVVPQAQTNPQTAPIHRQLQARGTHCLMIIPLVNRGEVIGTIGVDLAEEGREFVEADVKLAETIAGQVATAVANARLFEETQAALEERERAEEALRASEAKYRELVENANSIIFRMDTTGCVTFFNEFAQSFFGYSEDEILGKNIVGTIVPETDFAGNNLREMIDHILKDPERYANNENENMRRNGERVWVLWTNKAILDDEGRISEVLCIGNDVTKRKQAEEALRTSEALYSSLVNSLPQNIFRKDLEGRFIFANQRFCALEGKSEEEIIGLNDYDLYPPELAKKYREDDQRVIETGEIIELAEAHPMPNGETGYVRTVKIPIYDSLGRVTGIQAMFWDITERQRAQQELQFQKTLLEAQGEASPDGILVVSNEREILSFNRRFVEMWNIPDQVIEGGSSRVAVETVWDLLDDPEAFQARLDYLYAHPDEESREEILLKDGRILDRYSAPVKSPDGTHYGRVWYFRDITERKQAEEALRRSEATTRALLHAIPDLILRLDENGTYLDFEAPAREFGLEATREERVGKTLHDILPEEVAEQLVQAVQRALGTDETQFSEYQLSPKGILQHREARTVAIGEGEALTIVRDITERKQAEIARQEALRRTQLLYNISEALNTITDRRTAFDTVLGEYLRLLRLERGGLMLFNLSEHNKLESLYIDGHIAEPALTIPFEKDLIAQHLIENQYPLVIEDADTHPLTIHYQEFRAQVGSMLLIPLISRGGTIGILGADAPEKGHNFTQEDIASGEAVADLLTIWLENRQLLDEAQHRSSLLQTAAEVSKQASSILDMDQLIDTSVNFIRDQFDFYYVGMFLIDNAHEWAVLRAGTGEAGRLQLEAGHQLEIGGESMIGWCIEHRQARTALDVGKDPVQFKNPYLPDTHSELALPLISRDEVIGALTVQSVERDAFSEEDIALLQTMADQLGNAIANARLFENVAHSQKTAEALLQETQALHQLSQALAGTLRVNDILDLFFQACTQDIGFEYVMFSLVDQYQKRVKAIAGVGVTDSHLERSNRPLDGNDIMCDIVRTGQTEVIVGWDDRFDQETYEAEGHADWVRVFTPITLRQEHIGLVEAGFRRRDMVIEDSHLRLLRAFIDQTALALDNAQRYESSQRVARREAQIKEIIAKVRASTDLDTILQTTVKEVGDAIGGKRSYIHLTAPPNGESNHNR